MAYRLNEDNSILYNSNVALLKAADDVGKNTLTEILKVANSETGTINVLALNYVASQNVWLNVKGKYILFDLSNKGAGVDLVEKYQAKYDEKAFPNKDTEVANISGGALATDGGVALTSNAGVVIDVPKESDVKQAKIKKEI